MSQRWRATGNTVYDLTGPRFEPQTFRSRDERVTARPTGRLVHRFILFTLCEINIKLNIDALTNAIIYLLQTFQRRFEGSVHFQRNWNAYKRGFENLATEFCLGRYVLRYSDSFLSEFIILCMNSTKSKSIVFM